MIETVVVGYGLAGRVFHCPLIQRQPKLRLQGIVARTASTRAEATATWGVTGYSSLDEALENPSVQLIVIATPHDSHPDLVVRALEAGKHCVVDKVMALTTAEADRMIAARDASGGMLSVFHNRRWDWDYTTLQETLAHGLIGRPLLFESSVCRHSPPRTWRGHLKQAGTILHDWGAHLVDQALQLGLGPCRRLSAWITPAPWPEVDSGGHGRMLLEFDGARFQAEMSRICSLDRPRWWVVGTDGGFTKFGVDPQEEALRAGNIDQAQEPAGRQAVLRRATPSGEVVDTPLETRRGHWDSYYANIVDHLEGSAPLAVTAEQGREVVRLLEAAVRSAEAHQSVEGPWGY